MTDLLVIGTGIVGLTLLTLALNSSNRTVRAAAIRALGLLAAVAVAGAVALTIAEAVTP